MFINEVPNNADISAVIITELRNNYNIKYRKEKKQKPASLSGTQRIFQKPLITLDFTEVTLSTGNVCEIPRFVVEACERILTEVGVEGLFRKAGSALRQKEIRDQLESGQPLNHTHSVVDVANILKYFFRELPEALLPNGNFQECILRCLLCKGSNERRIMAMKLVCLLLPTHHLNTLVYFMQFLNAVSQHANQNKMSVKNLAIIFAPGLMPLLENIGQRLLSHVQVIEILIENAKDLGIIPSAILGKIQNIVLAECQHRGISTVESTSACSNQLEAPWTDSKKKKKRRSGSLTRMFNGLRKIVGAIGGSAEDLETTPDIQNSFPQTTPCLTKSTKKRRVLETSAFTVKKKKDVLEMLPSGSILPSTPSCAKPAKKSRLSLGKRYPSIQQVQTPAATKEQTIVSKRLSLDKRWDRREQLDEIDDNSSDGILEPLAKKRVLNKLPSGVEPLEADIKENLINNESYLKISKSEYEEIKDRVTAIETRISREFTKLQSSIGNDSIDSVEMLETAHLNGPAKVLDKYERTLEETEMINSSPSTEHLANCLSRGLKIRRSAEQKVFRSPSARKIGNIRRRSQENVRLSRNKSWHLGNKGVPMVTANPISTEPTDNQYFVPSSAVTTVGRVKPVNSFYPPKPITRRSQSSVPPTTVSQKNPSPAATLISDQANNIQLPSYAETKPIIDHQLQNEKWVCADVFFDDSMSQSNFSSPSAISISAARRKRTRDKKLCGTDTETTPTAVARTASNALSCDSIKTPMLPPRMTTVKRANAMSSASRSPYTKHPALTYKTHLTPLLQQDHHPAAGRASIARLRSQNAGMVLAKAKLFDELGTDLRNNRNGKVITRNNDDQNMNQFHAQAMSANTVGLKRIGIENNPLQNNRKITPRKQNGRNSPIGVQRRQNLRHINYTPIKKSPLAITTAILSISAQNTTPIQSPIKPDTTPQIKRPLTVKNPRRLVRTPQNKRTVASPLRATTPFKYRNSPRLHAIK